MPRIGVCMLMKQEVHVRTELYCIPLPLINALENAPLFKNQSFYDVSSFANNLIWYLELYSFGLRDFSNPSVCY